MNIKHILKLAALIFVVSFTMNFVSSPPAEAIKCTKGKLHTDNNLCWNENVNKTQTSDCPYRNSSGQCVNYTYAGAPVNDDGSKIDPKNIQCDAGYEAHDDGFCWKPEYKESGHTKAACDELNRTKQTHHWDAGRGKCMWKQGGYEDKREPLGYDNKQAEIDQKKQECRDNGGLVRTVQGNASGGFDCVPNEDACKNVKGTWNPRTQKCENIPKKSGANNQQPTYTANTGNCGQARTNLIDCTDSDCPKDSEEGGAQCIGNVLQIILFVLTVIVGLVAVGGIVYAAILYASAEDNSGQISQAKGIIRDVAIGIVLYALMVAITNWLIPGGVLG